MEILKVFFGKRGDGIWQIQSLKPIALDPEDGCQADFYKVKDDLFVGDIPFIGTIRSIMGQSIVPIVANVPGESVLRCLGTGFFVSCTGLMLTAAHIITNPIERKYGGVRELDDQTWQLGELKMGVMVPTNPLNGFQGYVFRSMEWAGFLAERTDSPLPIEGVNLKLTSDTAICKIEPLATDVPYQPLAIVQRGIQGLGMRVGKSATAVGYAGMKDVELTQSNESLVIGDFQFNLHVARGAILEQFPDNSRTRRASSPGACFSASLKLPPGMSGSPIFDDERIYVHGVVSKGLEDETGIANFGYGSMLASVLALPIKQMESRSLLDMQHSHDQGIPIVNIPDA